MVIHSCFAEKFGIPRQPGLAPHAVGTLELFHDYGREEMVKELEQFSHVWITFLFHRVVAEGWRGTVRPPWLGGQKRVGVFASRSPHRPNFLGMSVVRLERVRREKKHFLLDLSGVDMLDQTPVVDIRPYLPYSDCIADARGGYTAPTPTVTVTLSPQANIFCMEYEQKYDRKLKELLLEVIGQDPRPSSQKGEDKVYGVLLWDVNCRFVFSENGRAEVISCEINGQ